MAATVLISGANRGIGRGLVQKYLTRPNTTVLAAVRSPSSEDSQSLQSIAAATGSQVVILKVDSTSDEDALEAIEFAKSQGITAIDTVIANAGTFTPAAYQPVADVDLAHVKEHLDINTVGPVRLFQAVFPLLQKSENAKFIVISSLVGTIGGLKDIPYPNAAYGASKAAVNFFTRKIHFENEHIVTLAVHPGAVKTVSGNEACQAVGFPEAFVEIQDSVNALVAKFDAISKEDGSGEFWGYDGSTIPW